MLSPRRLRRSAVLAGEFAIVVQALPECGDVLGYLRKRPPPAGGEGTPNLGVIGGHRGGVLLNVLGQPAMSAAGVEAVKEPDLRRRGRRHACEARLVVSVLGTKLAHGSAPLQPDHWRSSRCAPARRF